MRSRSLLLPVELPVFRRTPHRGAGKELDAALRRTNAEIIEQYLLGRDRQALDDAWKRPKFGTNDAHEQGPMELKPDEQYIADPDEEIIAIELRSGERTTCSIILSALKVKMERMS